MTDLPQNSDQNSDQWNIFFLRRIIWVFFCRRTQNFIIIDQKKHKIKQIYIDTLLIM